MGEFTPRFERDMDSSRSMGPKMLPTAGAIAVRNEKGQLTMQKTEIEGRPMDKRREAMNRQTAIVPLTKSCLSHLVYLRLEGNEMILDIVDCRESVMRSRPAPALVRKADREPSPSSSSEDDEADEQRRRERARARRREHETIEETVTKLEEQEEDEEDDFERRRELLRERAKRREEEELLAKVEAEEEEAEEESEEETSADESESEEDAGPRLKPVFVRKRDRVTLVDAEKEEQRMRQLKIEEDKQKDERRRISAKLVEDAVRREIELEKRKAEDNVDLSAVPTDDENEEIAYESWKLREMKRMKRERDTREALAKEKAELDRVHNMTEEERRAYQRLNPRVVTNKAEKGKYKYLQKYYHRGAYFLDEEEDVLKRDVAQATLEDRFDKSVLPKVMQVKDFGKAGRTKWTHLTNEDTTDHQGAWAAPTAINTKFYTKHAAGTRNTFERPAAKKRRTE